MARFTAWCVRRPLWVITGLLLVLVCEIGFSIRLNSQTFDESVHLFFCYQHWRHRDFGAGRISQQYVVSPDGQRFLVGTLVDEAAAITLILNWAPGR